MIRRKMITKEVYLVANGQEEIGFNNKNRECKMIHLNLQIARIASKMITLMSSYNKTKLDSATRDRDCKDLK